MAMRIIRGDLIQLAKEGRFDTIIHGCNCFCTMGAGIAKQIKENFPQAYEADIKTNYGDRNKLGTYTYGIWNNVTDPSLPVSHLLTVYNAYTQYNYSTEYRTVDYDAVRNSLMTISKQLSIHDRIGLPKIGCGLGGGEWEIVSRIIDEVMIDFDVTIVEWHSNTR